MFYANISDAIGSTREMVKDTQVVADAYSYNAWGEDFYQLVPPGTNKVRNPYRFGGKHGYYTDDSTGLQLLGARYYDPLIGRFITQDPAQDGLNWYAYAGNNPVGNVDPTGMSWDDSETVRKIPIVGDLLRATDKFGETDAKYNMGQASGLEMFGAAAMWGVELGGAALGIEAVGKGIARSVVKGVAKKTLQGSVEKAVEKGVSTTAKSIYKENGHFTDEVAEIVKIAKQYKNKPMSKELANKICEQAKKAGISEARVEVGKIRGVANVEHFNLLNYHIMIGK